MQAWSLRASVGAVASSARCRSARPALPSISLPRFLREFGQNRGQRVDRREVVVPRATIVLLQPFLELGQALAETARRPLEMEGLQPSVGSWRRVHPSAGTLAASHAGARRVRR